MTTKEFFSNKHIAPFLAFVCAIAWAGAFPLIKLGYQEIALPHLADKFVFAGLRFTLAGVVSLLVAYLMGKSFVVPTASCRRNLMLFTLINITLHYLLSYTGLAYLASSRSVILDSLGSFFMIVLSGLLFVDDKFTPAKLLGCLLGFAGVVIMNYQPGQDLFADITFMGDGMIILNTFCIAGGGIYAKFVSREMDVMVATGYSLLFGGALIWLGGLALGGSITLTTSKAVWIVAVLIAISAFSFCIYNQLISYNPISKIAIFNSLMPVAGVLISSWLLGEPYILRYYLAALMVAMGIYVINSRK